MTANNFREALTEATNQAIYMHKCKEMAKVKISKYVLKFKHNTFINIINFMKKKYFRLVDRIRVKDEQGMLVFISLFQYIIFQLFKKT